jgi:hypothetical protein
LFDSLSELRFESSRVTCTYLEVLNDDCTDLFHELDGEPPKLRVVDNKDGRGVYCLGLSEVQVASALEVTVWVKWWP